MIETPRIVTTAPQHYASLRFTVPRAEIRKYMGEGLAEVKHALATQSVEASGPWFTRHFKRPAEFFDYEICIPVAEPIRALGRVLPAVWPAMQVARTVYHGDYTQLGKGWGEFESWIAEHDTKVTEDLWEVYLVDPGTSQDPASWRTQLNKPLTA